MGVDRGLTCRDDGAVEGTDESRPYPAGLVLRDRKVLVVGGGHVAQRRVPGLLAAGARVVVVAPDVTPAVEGLAGGGEITWDGTVTVTDAGQFG